MADGDWHFADQLGNGRFATRCGIQLEMAANARDGLWVRRKGGEPIVALKTAQVVTCAVCRRGLGLEPLAAPAAQHLDDTQPMDPLVETTMVLAREIANPSPPEPSNPPLETEAAPKPPWRCFHCDEVFTDRQAAVDHFGISENDKPGCVVALTETQKAIVEDRRMWRTHAQHCETHAAEMERQLHQHQHDIGFLFNGCKTLADVAHEFDRLRGEMLSNKEAAERYRWLRNREGMTSLTGPIANFLALNRDMEGGLDAAIDAAMKQEG